MNYYDTILKLLFEYLQVQYYMGTYKNTYSNMPMNVFGNSSNVSDNKIHTNFLYKNLI